MTKSHEVLRDSISKAGVKAVAADMNLSTSLIYKWCEESDGDTAPGAENPLDRLMHIYELTGDSGPIEWLCQQANGFLVKNPKISKESKDSILMSTQKILNDFSTLLKTVSQSYENDGDIDNKESKKIRKEWENLKGVTESFVLACENGLYEK